MASKEELRKLMLAMNPDAEQIEEAVAAAPRVPKVAKSLGKGFYEANVEPLLSPYDTATAIFGAGQEFVRDPKEFSRSVAKAELERLKAAEQTPEAAAEYAGSFISPFSMLRRVPRSDVVRPKSGMVLDYPDAPKVLLRDKDQNLDEAYQTIRFPRGFVNRTIENGKSTLEGLVLDEPGKKAAIADFLDTKVRKYYVNQFGTKDDPIFKAIKEGRLSTEELRAFGGIREFLPKAAKEGRTRLNPETGQETFYPSSSAQAALEDMSRIYDKMTGMQGSVLTNRTIGRKDLQYSAFPQEYANVSAKRNETTQQLIDEGSPVYMINPSTGLIGYKDPAFTQGKDPRERLLSVSDEGPLRIDASKDLKALQLADPSGFPKSLKTAIEKGQPVYDMQPQDALAKILSTEKLVEHLATLPTREIKNLRFEDAVRGAVKARELIDARQSLVRRIENGQPVDPKIFLQGVSSPLLEYGKDATFPGFTWRQITDPEATAVEGAYIGHSVGGYAKGGGYGPKAHEQFLKGDAKIYTLRDPSGKPVTTVEVKEIEGRGPVATQIRGAGNKSGNAGDKTPYDALLVDLFNKLNLAGISEYDDQLPPLSRAYKQEREAATRVQVRGRLGAPQPIGRLAPEEPPVPQQVPAAPIQQGIGQLPQAPQNPPPRFFRNMNDADFLRFLRRLRGMPEGEE